MHTTTSHTSEGKKRNGEHILINMTYIAKNVDLDSGIELTRAFEYWRRYFEENNIVSALVIRVCPHFKNGDKNEINCSQTRKIVQLISRYYPAI